MPGGKPGRTSKASPRKEGLKPYVLSGAYAQRMGVPDGTKVFYTEYTQEELKGWAAWGAKVEDAEVLMKEVYSADGREKLGGNLRVAKGS